MVCREWGNGSNAIRSRPAAILVRQAGSGNAECCHGVWEVELKAE
jgi:hypothetical protein